MKFTPSLSTLLVILPLFAAQAHAAVVPEHLGRRAASSSAAAKPAVSSAAAAKPAVSSATAAKPAVSSAASSSSAVKASSTSSTAPAATTSASAADLQTSLTLDPSQVQPGLAQNGQAVQEAGQVASLTSTNNFINFCATLPNLPLTNGQQVKTGSCNPTIMGVIISQDVMPSCKFVFPANLDVIPSNTAFTIQMAINNVETGNFVNAQQNYFAAPSQTNSQGILIGHSHVVIESIPSLTSTALTDPTRFAFFKGLNAAAVNGILTADVSGGLPAGTYKLSSINSAANHQPVLVAVAQHAALDDAVYFTVSDTATTTGSSASSAAAPPAASSAASAKPPAASSSAAAKPAASSAAAAKPAVSSAAASAAKPAATNGAIATKPATSSAAATKNNNNNNNGNNFFSGIFGGFHF